VTVTGNVTVGANSTFDAYAGNTLTRIDGNLTVEGCTEARLGDPGTETQITIGGNVAIRQCAHVAIHDTDISGNFSLTGSTFQSNIHRANISGNVRISDNAVAIATSFEGGTVGGNVEIADNTGRTSIDNNIISGNLRCEGNADLAGGANTVDGHKAGQCAGF
jgi:hypothetical protein